jgi:uncharacterized membrane protein
MSVFGDSINFLVKLGVYDIVLPFLLVFVLVFALLEKTKILGIEIAPNEKGEKSEYTKKNLNSMVAFVTGFFVVASTQLVAVINKSVSQIFLLMLLIVCFLMVAGAFHKQEKDGFFLNPKEHGFYYSAFMAIVFISIIAIFLNALGWLQLGYDFLKDNWNTDYFAAVLFIVIIIGFMAWIMKDQKPAPVEDKSK